MYRLTRKDSRELEKSQVSVSFLSVTTANTTLIYLLRLGGLNNTGYYVYIISLFSLLVGILCKDANGVFEITSKASDGKKGKDGKK